MKDPKCEGTEGETVGSLEKEKNGILRIFLRICRKRRQKELSKEQKLLYKKKSI